jgi:hypothetical protein
VSQRLDGAALELAAIASSDGSPSNSIEKVFARRRHGSNESSRFPLTVPAGVLRYITSRVRDRHRFVRYRVHSTSTTAVSWPAKASLWQTTWQVSCSRPRLIFLLLSRRARFERVYNRELWKGLSASSLRGTRRRVVSCARHFAALSVCRSCLQSELAWTRRSMTSGVACIPIL